MLRRYKQIYWSMSALFNGVGHFVRKIYVEGDVALQPLLVSENYSAFATSQ